MHRPEKTPNPSQSNGALTATTRLHRWSQSCFCTRHPPVAATVSTIVSTTPNETTNGTSNGFPFATNEHFEQQLLARARKDTVNLKDRQADPVRRAYRCIVLGYPVVENWTRTDTKGLPRMFKFQSADDNKIIYCTLPEEEAKRKEGACIVYEHTGDDIHHYPAIPLIRPALLLATQTKREMREQY